MTAIPARKTILLWVAWVIFFGFTVANAYFATNTESWHKYISLLATIVCYQTAASIWREIFNMEGRT